jgi:hypothetical protein
MAINRRGACTALLTQALGLTSLKFLHLPLEFPCSINRLRWISGLSF